MGRFHHFPRKATQGEIYCLILDLGPNADRRERFDLMQCLQGYPQFPVIPHKLIVAKRLSQCLNPALPTGVHQRALDVYTHILTAIGVSLSQFIQNEITPLTRRSSHSLKTFEEISRHGRVVFSLSSSMQLHRSRYRCLLSDSCEMY